MISTGRFRITRQYSRNFKTTIVMKIYVGRWNLLPEEWEGINGLYEKPEEEIRKEILRQIDLVAEDSNDEGDYIGIYEPFEFEEEFNHSHSGWLTSDKYFIKIF